MTGSPQHHEIHQDDFGRWRVGLCDEGTGFESRTFAMSVAGYLPTIAVAPRTTFFKIKKEGRLAALSSA